MPSYDMRCDACGVATEIRQSIKDPLPTACTACGAASLRPQPHPPTILDATPRTLGTLAERNTHAAGRTYAREEHWRQLKEGNKACRQQVAEELPKGMRPVGITPEKPWWRKDDTPNYDLLKLSPQEQQNYVMTGDSTVRAPE